MSRILRSRVLAYVSNATRSRPFTSSASIAASPPKESVASSNASLGDPPPPPPPSPPSRSSGPSKSWKVLKYGSLAALAGAMGGAAYVTYAYSLDELEQKMRNFRELLSHPVGDDASAFRKLQASAYSIALKVPVKTIELYMDIRRIIDEQIRGYTEPFSDKLLPDLHPLEQGVFTLVLDLNETLVYSDWKRERGWKTFKRPGVDAFLEHLAKFYEIVVYSDELNIYVHTVLDRLDNKGCVRYRLSREATKYQNGKHYRDLSKLNRDPSRIIYLSGHALETCLQPENCVTIKPWKLENNDTTLIDLIPFLEYVAQHRPADIRQVLASYQGRDIASEFIERSKEYQRRMQEQKQHKPFWRR